MGRHDWWCFDGIIDGTVTNKSCTTCSSPPSKPTWNKRSMHTVQTTAWCSSYVGHLCVQTYKYSQSQMNLRLYIRSLGVCILWQMRRIILKFEFVTLSSLQSYSSSLWNSNWKIICTNFIYIRLIDLIDRSDRKFSLISFVAKATGWYLNKLQKHDTLEACPRWRLRDGFCAVTP